MCSPVLGGKDVDGRDEPGHDEWGAPEPKSQLSLAFVFRCDLIQNESQIA